MPDQTAPTDDQGLSAEEREAANKFDLRRIIGGLFLVYGVVLTITGLLDSDSEVKKAAGVHINLYAGLGMLVFAALMLLWGFARPLGRELDAQET
jgi:hypothetical protein